MTATNAKQCEIFINNWEAGRKRKKKVNIYFEKLDG